jgi:hypothetical protein
MKNGVFMKTLLMALLALNVSFASEYEAAITETNNYLEYHQDKLLRCPGTKLVVSCGNLACQPYLGETIENCPADCTQNVGVRSYNNITLCTDYDESQIPHTATEVADIVKMAISKGKKVRAIGASHSATDVMCSEGVLVPMEKLNQVIGIRKANGVMIVDTQPGITVFALSEWLYKKGYALEGLPHMGFRDVTVGGAMATGSHGSTTKHAGVISNIVEAVEVIDGTGSKKVIDATSDRDTLRAHRASLGLLGIMTKVSLRIQKSFNLDVRISYHHEKEILQKGLINSVKDCDYGQLNWFPGMKKYMKTCGTKTNLKAHAGAHNELLKPKVPKFLVNPFKKVLQYGACNNKVMCLVEKVRWLQFKLQPPVVRKVKKKSKNRHRVIGPAHRMVSSHLIKEQDGFFQMDWEIAVPQSRAQEALLAIKEHVNKNKTCLPLVGVFIRFAPIDDATLMAHTHADNGDWKKGDVAVFFEMPVYVPVGLSREAFREYERPYVEFAQMLIENYSGRPHFGKNRQWTFDLMTSLGSERENRNAFKSVLNRFDPNGIFRNQFATKLGF